MTGVIWLRKGQRCILGVGDRSRRSCVKCEIAKVGSKGREDSAVLYGLPSAWKSDRRIRVTWAATQAPGPRPKMLMPIIPPRISTYAISTYLSSAHLREGLVYHQPRFCAPTGSHCLPLNSARPRKAVSIHAKCLV